jgi:hypothetical protein
VQANNRKSAEPPHDPHTTAFTAEGGARTIAASLPLGSISPYNKSLTVSRSPVCKLAVVPMVAAAARETTTTSLNRLGFQRAMASTTDAVVIFVMDATHLRSRWCAPASTWPVAPSATTHASAEMNGVSTLRDTLAAAAAAAAAAEAAPEEEEEEEAEAAVGGAALKMNEGVDAEDMRGGDTDGVVMPTVL